MKHGCHNRRAFLPSMLVQDGWQNQPGPTPPQSTRVPLMKAVPFRMAEDCRYVPPAGQVDPGCDGCRWRQHP
jgi:hypothetical protein